MSRFAMRLAPLGTFAGLGTLLVTTEAWPLAIPFGLLTFFSGKRLLDRRGNERRELMRRVRDNVRELSRAAREDKVAAKQMKRLAVLQEGILQSWQMLGEQYGPLLQEDLHTIVGEVGAAARLARRRTALRRHLESVDRRAISRRIRDLEEDLAGLEAGSPLRAPFEAALEGRRGELAACDGLPHAISAINAQLEAVEGMLANLNGDLLSLDPNLSPYALESGLVSIKERVTYFRRGLDETTRNVESLLADAETRNIAAPSAETTDRLRVR